MKIMQIIPSLALAGGAEKFVIDLSIALKSLGHDVLILVLYNDEVNFFQDEIDSNKINIIHLNRKKGLDISNSFALRMEILKYKPDVVHTHLRTHLSMRLSGLWNKRTGIKYVHTIHSVPTRECPKPILFYIMKPLYQKHIVEPIGITSSLATETKTYYHLNYLPCSIYNGIFVEKFISSISYEKRTINFISVASFQANKNQISIVQAAIILQKKGYKFIVTFLGGGVEFENVKQYAAEHNALDYIVFEGQVKNVMSYLSNSRCLLIPSYVEGNPISILEAMAAGLVVIATMNGGPKDVIEEGVNGYLVNPFSVDELALKMEKTLLDDMKMKKISIKNIETVQKYDILAVANEYLLHYKKTSRIV